MALTSDKSCQLVAVVTASTSKGGCMVDLGLFKESMGRYLVYHVLLGGIIIAVKLLFRNLDSWLRRKR